MAQSEADRHEACLILPVSTFPGPPHLIDGSCHVLNRSIFLPPLRMLRLDCKQTCCRVTVYQPPSVASATSCLDLPEETCFSVIMHVVIGTLLVENGWLTVKARLSNVCCIHHCLEQNTGKY